MENEFDFSEVEGFEDIPGRPRPVIDSNTAQNSSPPSARTTLADAGYSPETAPRASVRAHAAYAAFHAAPGPHARASKAYRFERSARQSGALDGNASAGRLAAREQTPNANAAPAPPRARMRWTTSGGRPTSVRRGAGLRRSGASSNRAPPPCASPVPRPKAVPAAAKPRSLHTRPLYRVPGTTTPSGPAAAIVSRSPRGRICVNCHKWHN